MGNAAICGERSVKIKREDGKTLKLRPSLNLNARRVLNKYPGHSIIEAYSGRELSGSEVLEPGNVYMLLRCPPKLDLCVGETANGKKYIISGGKHDSPAKASFYLGDGAALRVKIRIKRSELEALMSVATSDSKAEKVLATLRLRRTCPRPQARQIRWTPSLESIAEVISPGPREKLR